jgi:hypothetical protein
MMMFGSKRPMMPPMLAVVLLAKALEMLVWPVKNELRIEMVGTRVGIIR